MKILPKIIETEENEAAIALAEELEHRDRTLEEDAFLKLLVTLIYKFEQEHYPFPVCDPLQLLLHLEVFSLELFTVALEDISGDPLLVH